jgi:hypothetical protein
LKCSLIDDERQALPRRQREVATARGADTKRVKELFAEEIDFASRAIKLEFAQCVKHRLIFGAAMTGFVLE